MKLAVWHTDDLREPDTRLNELTQEDGDMGFFDSLKEALGGDKDESGSSSEPRHVDREAAEETPAQPQASGGKHAARD